MKDVAVRELTRRFGEALRDYLAGAAESALLRAYEAGREAIGREGEGILHLVAAHQEAVLDAVAGASPEEAVGILEASWRLLTESLGPFEMATRGYRETNVALRRLNESLEQQVSERSRALRRSEERFRLLVEHALDIVIVLGEDARVRYVNPAVKRVLGQAPQDLTGKPILPGIHPGDRHAFLESCRNAGGTTAPGPPFSFRVRHADGSWRHLEAVANQIERGGTASIIAIARDVTDRTRTEQELRQSLELLQRMDAERRRLLVQAINAQEEERRRIASDIHDDPIQIMSAVGMRLHALRSHLDDASTEEVLDKLEQDTRTAIRRLRHLMFELRPRVLDREGLAAALRIALERVREETGITCRLEDRLDREPPPQTRAVAYRIAQEALSNARKHAGASVLEVELGERDRGVLVLVRDDGEGFDPEQVQHRPGHQGLIDMRERAEMLQGRCRIRSAPGEGCTVEIWLPMDDGEAP